MVSIDGEVERPVTRVSVGRGKIERRKKRAARVRPGFYTALRSTPRHTIEQGQAASEREKGSTPPRCRPCVEKEMRTKPPPSFIFF
jgi:hypothetical protein